MNIAVSSDTALLALHQDDYKFVVMNKISNRNSPREYHKLNQNKYAAWPRVSKFILKCFPRTIHEVPTTIYRELNFGLPLDVLRSMQGILVKPGADGEKRMKGEGQSWRSPLKLVTFR